MVYGIKYQEVIIGVVDTKGDVGESIKTSIQEIADEILDRSDDFYEAYDEIQEELEKLGYSLLDIDIIDLD